MVVLVTWQEQDLAKVPPQLWAQEPYKVGLINTAKPVTLQEGAIQPWVRQYPLSKETDEGIAPTIQALIDQENLHMGVSPCNTPIFLVKKSKGGTQHLVEDLHRLSDIMFPEFPIVPDPSVILTSILVDTCYFSILDIQKSFFGILLHPGSQYLTTLTFRGVQLLYRRLPQGYCESSSIFNRILGKDLATSNPADPLYSTLMTS
ncbi:hypothetical protein NDU88_002676 [Pleurodeles waltl]|uniref:Reverse transcriptase domain-containing protein n=1 Tax=Pleurodeles waltl TaxID=8319 RepID=A0AAV7VDI3_PLEWA|nr:hypothetical protein NDU88_002676 [Pleurodeles waltl]